MQRTLIELIEAGQDTTQVSDIIKNSIRENRNPLNTPVDNNGNTLLMTAVAAMKSNMVNIISSFHDKIDLGVKNAAGQDIYKFCDALKEKHSDDTDEDRDMRKQIVEMKNIIKGNDTRNIKQERGTTENFDKKSLAKALETMAEESKYIIELKAIGESANVKPMQAYLDLADYKNNNREALAKAQTVDGSKLAGVVVAMDAHVKERLQSHVTHFIKDLASQAPPAALKAIADYKKENGQVLVTQPHLLGALTEYTAALTKKLQDSAGPNRSQSMQEVGAGVKFSEDVQRSKTAPATLEISEAQKHVARESARRQEEKRQSQHAMAPLKAPRMGGSPAGTPPIRRKQKEEEPAKAQENDQVSRPRMGK